MTNNQTATPAPSEGWAIELTGDRIDLDDFREALRPPFFPYVEDYKEGDTTTLLLRSDTWPLSSNGNAIMADARRLIDQLNGAHLVMQGDARPVELGRTLRFDGNGKLVPVMIAGTFEVTLRGGRVRGQGIVGGSAPPPPAPSPLQGWIARAKTDDYVADLLVFLTRADNWFDIYKAMEEVERIVGGQQAAKVRWPDWARTRQTANRARHAPHPSLTAHANPPTIEDARQIVLHAARELSPPAKP